MFTHVSNAVWRHAAPGAVAGETPAEGSAVRRAAIREDPGSSIPNALRDLILDADRRDAQLGFIVLVALLVVTAGVAAIFAPNLAWGIETIRVDLRYLPQLIAGLIVLTVLFNFYVVVQRRALRKTRLALLEQIARADDAITDSFVDPLTGIFNRRYMEMALAREAKRAERTDGVFSLIMIDVNDLGAINDRGGHAEGDRLLQRVAHVLQDVFRQSDTVVRYGGDEFLVVLPDTNEAGARIALNRLLERVETTNSTRAPKEPGMGLSCGLASYEKGKQVGDVIELADQRMYAHKSDKVRGGESGHVADRNGAAAECVPTDPDLQANAVRR